MSTNLGFSDDEISEEQIYELQQPLNNNGCLEAHNDNVDLDGSKTDDFLQRSSADISNENTAFKSNCSDNLNSVDNASAGTADSDVDCNSQSVKKQNREGSPFKEAIKDFVRNKLTKKPGNVDNTCSNLPTEKRTIFSGIKEKLARKLEDNRGKDATVSAEELQNISEKSSSASELDHLLKAECELKSVVANDHQEPVVIVEEAEECFEEPKMKQNVNNVSCADVIPRDSNVLVGSAPRSKTMSSIAATSHMFKSKRTSEKDISITFSDLQKADDLDVDGIDSTCPMSSGVKQESCRSVPSVPVSDLIANSENPCSVSGEQAFENSHRRNYATHALENIYRFIEVIVRFCFHIHVLVLVAAIVVYNVLYGHPFLAGFLCGILLITFVLLLSYEFTVFLMQQVSGPEYKTLQFYGEQLSTSISLQKHQGWMNYLRGDYNPEFFSLYNTVSVFVCVEDNKLCLSYTKKNIPRYAMWNEKPVLNSSFVRHEWHHLRGAKVVLVPEGLPESRRWNKKHPLCILLPLQEGRRRSSEDLTNAASKEAEVEKPAKCSSATSLPPSPAHQLPKQNEIFLFARTDREKEEWYWVFFNAALDDRDSSYSFKSSSNIVPEDIVPAAVPQLSPSLPPSPSISLQPDKITSDIVKDDTSPLAVKFQNIQKPHLDFDQYMTVLLQQSEMQVNANGNSSMQWLNVFLGRLFYDFLVQKSWAENVQRRIQSKLDRIKMPPYMQKLVVTDVYLGTSLPQIQNTSQPVIDERGIWFDLDIVYKGYFQMTLETKFKSPQPKTSSLHEEDQKGEELADSLSSLETCKEASNVSDVLGELWDEEEEIHEVETPKEESPTHQVAVSTGAKLLQSVEKWVTSSNLVDNRFVKRCVGHLTQARLLLTVEVNSLQGTLALNIRPLPTDRLWYGFRRNPELSLNIFPKVGDRHISLMPIIQLIKRKLLLEFQKALVMPNMDDIVVPFMFSSICEQ